MRAWAGVPFDLVMQVSFADNLLLMPLIMSCCVNVLLSKTLFGSHDTFTMLTTYNNVLFCLSICCNNQLRLVCSINLKALEKKENWSSSEKI